MHVITHDLDPYPTMDWYPTMDQRHVTMINVDYSVRVGYWASRNNV
jgi:hypothetical protein